MAIAALAQPQPGVGGNSPPVCTGGGFIFVECNAGADGFSRHVLDVGAVDPDGDPLTYDWRLTGSCQAIGSLDDNTLPNPTVTVDMQGLCFDECGGIKVLVSDGINPPIQCSMAIAIQDTTDPTISSLSDILELENPAVGGCPAQLDTSLTGVPTGSDNCDQNPVLTLISETFFSPSGPPWGTGIECVVDRTWEIVDCEGLSAQTSQNVTVVGPSFFDAAVLADITPGQCPNYVQANGQSGNSLEMTVFGSLTFDVTQVKPRTLQLARHDGIGGVVSPLLVLGGDLGEGDYDPCHSVIADGHADMLLLFDEDQTARHLQLDQAADGSVMLLEVSGLLENGTPFRAHDVVLIQN